MPNSKIEKKFGVAALPWELEAKNAREWALGVFSYHTQRYEVFLDNNKNDDNKTNF